MDGRNIQEELDEAGRNKVVYEKIAKRLKEARYDKDWIQYRAKVNKLKTLYIKVKDNNDQSMRARKACQYFEQLDTILGSRPATQRLKVFNSLQDGVANFRRREEGLNDGGDGGMVPKDVETGQYETEQNGCDKQQ